MRRQHDWMDPKAADRVVASLAAARPPLTPGDLRVLYTPDAGHYPQIDQPATFVCQVVEAVEAHLPAGAAAAVRAAAAALPRGRGAADTKAELEAEMAANPAAAEVHVASDM
jgi:hypothetical protein